MYRNLVSLVFALAFVSALAGEPPIHRRVAVTFDDLPAPSAGMVANDVASLREMTRKLLASLEKHGVPAVGLVTTQNLHRDGDTSDDLRARREVVQSWLDAGHEIGNHTHSHPSLNRTPLEAYEKDVLRAEGELEAILGAGKKPLWFRHPMLHVGTELDKRQRFESWLAERGYRVAAVTMDHDDYAYASALRRDEDDLARRLADDYVRYMEEIFAFWEEVSRAVVGREIPQVLLLHANALNADCFDRLAAMMKRRGYRFVSLEDAMADEAYDLPDDWVGPRGLSWLHHWALTAGKPRAADPDPPPWVLKAFENR